LHPKQYETTSKFAHAFARNVVLPAMLALPQVQSGQPFNSAELSQPILDQHPAKEQQAAWATRPNGEPGWTVHNDPISHDTCHDEVRSATTKCAKRH
jgi:hypothetical protein